MLKNDSHAKPALFCLSGIRFRILCCDQLVIKQQLTMYIKAINGCTSLDQAQAWIVIQSGKQTRRRVNMNTHIHYISDQASFLVRTVPSSVRLALTPVL